MVTWRDLRLLVGIDRGFSLVFRLSLVDVGGDRNLLDGGVGAGGVFCLEL